jgi:hypothetical protein
MNDVFRFFKSKKPETPKKMFSISKLWKSLDPKQDFSDPKEISAAAFPEDSSIKVNDEYQRIKNYFLEEIQSKIQNFWKLNDLCKTECENGINDEKTKEQLENMYNTASSADFLSMCGKINSNISQCNEATKLQRAIQDLFIMYKTDKTHDTSKEVLDAETNFYKETKTKIMKFTTGGRKTRFPKRKTKKQKKTKKNKNKP